VQIKALVGQIAGAVLIQEAIHWLVISLPTEKLVAVRRELSKPGQIRVLQADVDLSTPLLRWHVLLSPLQPLHPCLSTPRVVRRQQYSESAPLTLFRSGNFLLCSLSKKTGATNCVRFPPHAHASPSLPSETQERIRGTKSKACFVAPEQRGGHRGHRRWFA
jgi:hypothetical protein